MNFLLHHRLARRDLGAPAAAVGAMLPDLWRMVDKRVRAARGVVRSDDARVAEVLAGIEHHARADTAFHACEPFVQGERALTMALRAFAAPKLSLFGHVAWELCLDGALVRREGDTLVAQLAEGVARALEVRGGASAVEVAARLHRSARSHDDPLPTGFAPRVTRFLVEMARSKWVLGYARGERIAERIDGVRAGLGLPAVAAEDRSAVAAIFEGGIARAGDVLDGVIALRL